MRNKKTVAGYYRISVEDNEGGLSLNHLESNSITNQRLLITGYCQKHQELQQYEFMEYYDDGYSGTNMERPGIEKLLEKVKRQEVACIIVKDFSRFSRDYIELGSYMYQIFPFIGVRFISITDHYDSNNYIGRTADIDVEFKSLLADFYCKDVSEKVKSSLQAKKNNGKYSIGLVPFGYCKNKKDKMEISVIPEEAAVVQRIFKLSLLGNNTPQICKILNDEGVQTPLEFKRKQKDENKNDFPSKQKLWQAGTIRNILINEFYIGNMVYGKTKQAEVGSKKVIIKPRSEWKVFRNHHVPIIEKQLFNEVQNKFFKIKQNSRSSLKYPLKGKIYCGGCKRKMRVMKQSGDCLYFYCSYEQIVSENNCLKGSVDNAFLEALILLKIKDQIKKSAQLEEVKRTVNQRRALKLADDKKVIEKRKKSCKKIKQAKKKLLEAYHAGEISKEEFRNQKTLFDVRLSQNIDLVKSERSNDELLDTIRFKKINRTMVEVFVDAVYLYNDKTIKILWAFHNAEMKQ